MLSDCWLVVCSMGGLCGAPSLVAELVAEGAVDKLQRLIGEGRTQELWHTAAAHRGAIGARASIKHVAAN